MLHLFVPIAVFVARNYASTVYDTTIILSIRLSHPCMVW